MDAIKADTPPLLLKLGMHPFATKPWTRIHDTTHRLDQRTILNRLLEPVPLRAPWLSQRLARPALTHLLMPQTTTHRVNGPTPTFGVYKFGRAASFKIALSSSASASSFLSRAFSFSSSFICLAINGSIPPYFVRQR